MYDGKLLKPVPDKGVVQDYVLDPVKVKWQSWESTLPSYEIPKDAPFSSIIVPTRYTAAMSHMLELLLTRDHEVLVCGPTGTGKSAYIFNTITKQLDQEVYKPVMLGFSAKTSANMTQNIIDGKLDKRRKGIYGPPMGTRAVMFIDDVNMPEIEEYGAQPPIELLRQLVDSGGWYDLEDKSWRSIIDCTLLAAMGPPGGGRNEITPRMMRHFNLLAFESFDDKTLQRIFSTIVTWHFSKKFSAEVTKLGAAVVSATLATYRCAMAELLPTPSKSASHLRPPRAREVPGPRG